MVRTWRHSLCDPLYLVSPAATVTDVLISKFWVNWVLICHLPIIWKPWIYEWSLFAVFVGWDAGLRGWSDRFNKCCSDCRGQWCKVDLLFSLIDSAWSLCIAEIAGLSDIWTTVGFRIKMLYLFSECVSCKFFRYYMLQCFH